MISSNDVNPRRKRNCVPMIAGLSLALTLFSVSATAIAQNPESKPAETKPAGSYEAFFLANVTQQNEFNDVQTDLRNMLPKSKIFGMPSQHAISIWGPPEDLALAQKMITELDHAKKVYRLIYTIKETERGKPVGSRSVALVAVSGERTQMKQGSKVPIVTGATDSDSSKPNTQVQYLDVGTNIDATVDSFQDGVRLKTKFEESSIADERSSIGAQDPILHQTALEIIATLTLGKPLALGSIDLPGGTKHLEVEVVSELVK
jgi:hypothetical protein